MTTTVKNVVTKGRGRPALIDNKKKLTKFLADGQFDGLTFYMKTQLVDAGYLTVTKVQAGKRGRPADTLTVSGKGRGLVAMSKNWKTAA